MKLIIQGDKIAALVGDDYQGDEQAIPAPEGFDINQAHHFSHIGGQIVLTVPLVAQHWESIKAERDRRTQTGGYQVAGKWFHSDVFSRTQQMGLVMMAGDIPANLQWKTMDGSFVTMTPTLAGQVFAAAAASDAALFARAEQLRATMEADPLAFNLAGQTWPAVYGE